MKNILSLISLVTVSINISGIWVAVEFLIYLFKDKDFNWDSVNTLITLIVIEIILLSYSYFKLNKFNSKILEKRFNKYNKSR